MIAEPFSSLRVLEMARLAPGQMIGLHFADLGALVIRVDPPAATADPRDDPEYEINRNKRSVVLDLKDARDRQNYLELAATADVIIDAYRPGVMDRLGVGYSAVAESNPAVIYCAISGYGSHGPSSHRPGHDLNYIAASGVGSMITSEGRPVVPGVQIADYVGGTMNALVSILTALVGRQSTGKGGFLDVSMAGGMLWLVARDLVSRHRGSDVARTELLQGRLPCYSYYETADRRFVAVAAAEERFWNNLCDALGLPDLIGRGRDRGASGDAVRASLQGVFLQRTLNQWEELFSSIDTCVSAVLTLDEAAHLYASAEADDSFPRLRTLSGLGSPSPHPPARLGSNNAEFTYSPGR